MGRFILGFWYYRFSLTQGQRAGHSVTSRAQPGRDFSGRLLARLHQLVGQAGVILKFCSESSEISHAFLGVEREDSTKHWLSKVATGNFYNHDHFR